MPTKWLFSATQIDMFSSCQRKWGFRYLDEIQLAPSKAAELGTSIHSLLENYLITNEINFAIPQGQIIKPGLDYLPKILPKKFVEREFVFKKNGFFFNGVIDFLDKQENNTYLIGDHKTTSTLNTALTPDELKKNIQATIYAYWAFKEKDAQKVTLRWVYYKTKGKPQAKCVDAELSRDECQENFQPILQSAEEIKDIIERKQPSSSLPKNTSACFKYGPCPFYAQCKYGQEKPTQTQKIVASDQETQTNRKNSFHLYVDCTPTKKTHTYENTLELSDLLKPVIKKIQDEKDLSHYRMAGYGQHVGLIAHYLNSHLKEARFDEKTAVLTSVKTPEGCDTLQTLMGQADYVVRGF